MLENVKKMMSDSIIEKKTHLIDIDAELEAKKIRIEQLFQKRSDKLLAEKKVIEQEIKGLEKDLSDLEGLSKTK